MFAPPLPLTTGARCMSVLEHTVVWWERSEWESYRREAEGKEGERNDGGVGGEVYTLLTTTSSHVPSFLGTYYSEAL